MVKNDPTIWRRLKELKLAQFHIKRAKKRDGCERKAPASSPHHGTFVFLVCRLPTNVQNFVDFSISRTAQQPALEGNLRAVESRDQSLTGADNSGRLRPDLRLQDYPTIQYFRLRKFHQLRCLVMKVITEERAVGGL